MARSTWSRRSPPVARDAVQANLADAEHVGFVDEALDDGQHGGAQGTVLGLLRVQREPREVLDADLAARLPEVSQRIEVGGEGSGSHGRSRPRRPARSVRGSR